MVKAIRIGRYFIEHALAAFSMMGADDNTESCIRVVDWIQKQGLNVVTKREILRANRRFKNIKMVDPVIEKLIENNYLRESEQTRAGSVKRTDIFYKINPLLKPVNPRTHVTHVTNVGSEPAADDDNGYHGAYLKREVF